MGHQYNASLAVTAFSLLLSSPWRIVGAEASGIAITEIAYRGTGPDHCNGEDWIEFQNIFETTVDMAGWKFYDDNGPDDEDAWVIPDGYTVDPGAYKVACKDQDFLFGIGSSDAISVADAAGVVVDAISLPKDGPDEGATYALFENDTFAYTTTPTPGEANVLTEPMPLMEQLVEEINAAEDFFDLEGGMVDGVIDMNFTMGEEELKIIRDHPAWEQWTTFDGITMNAAGDDNAAVVASIASGGIRVRGQSTNTNTVCMGRKNTPFLIRFDTPFMGMEEMFLRNHLSDPSYMRDHGAHSMLKAYGLPYLRTRPARVFINGEYYGFYTVMDTPGNGQFMKRSFGDFDPEKAAIFKFKTFIDFCPFDQTDNVFKSFFMVPGGTDPNSPMPDPYYFERGDHRDDTPILRDLNGCQSFFTQQLAKEQADVERGSYEYGGQCGATMVNLGRIDRDFGPKSIEDKMIEFLDDYFYNENVKDLSPAVDIDDWIKNLAFMSVLLHYDSPIGVINNWYLATTNGGDGDWRIVQYDHNNMMTTEITPLLCRPECGPRMAYLPILQPTCGPLEEHKVVGRILTTDENMEKYVKYVSELVDVLTAEDGVISDLYDYGNIIKEYIVDDPSWSTTLEEYEDLELGDDIENYGIEESLHLLKFTRFRVQQVKEQIEAIEAGTLPRNGKYDPDAKCPDWRNSGVDIAKSGSTPGDDCAIPDCILAGLCYDNDPGICSLEGELQILDCALASPFCDSCFPHSRCGSATDLDNSGIFVSNIETCVEEELEICKFASPCFDHSTGRCAFDGSILTVDCQETVNLCEPCYPNSRCGSGDPPPMDNSNPVVGGGGDNAVDTGVFVPNNTTCGAGFEPCADAGPCFDHNLGLCAEDGSFTNSLCDSSVACAGCFPSSRCGGAGVDGDVVMDNSGVFTPNDDTCGPMMDMCAQAGPCFDHKMGLCADDGSFSEPMCEQAVACAPCFPSSRCGVGGATDAPQATEDSGAEVEEQEVTDEGEEPEQKEEEPSQASNDTLLEDGSGGVDRSSVFVSVLSLLVLSLGMLVVV